MSAYGPHAGTAPGGSGQVPRGEQAGEQQAREWAWDPALYQQQCGFVPELGLPVLELLAPVPGERILDLGCGDGALAVRLQGLGCHVLAVDSSPEMVAACRARGVPAEVVDGHDLAARLPSAQFDAVFSNAALHWMKDDPGAVVSGVRTCLLPGGRFVGEFGGFGNVAAIATALLGALRLRGLCSASRHPWFFPTAAQYQELLEREGFRVDHIELFYRPTELPGGIQSWVKAFGGPFLRGLSEEDKVEVFKEVEELLRPSLCTASGVWVADYVRLRFKATLI